MAGEKPLTLQQKIEKFLNANKIWLSILTGIVVIAIVAVVVGISVNRSVRDRQAEQLYALELAFADWQTELDEDDPQAGDILETLASESFPENSYAYFRQQFMYGIVYENLSDFENAATSFEMVIPASGYLGEAALLKAGLMYEAAGNIEAAIMNLETLVEDYDSAEEARVLFTLGRIQEGRSNYSDAARWYNTVVSDYSASGWSDFAQNRLIYLEARGLINE